MAGRLCWLGALGQRRSGKDRRRYIDPRYRNPEYPQFFDRRQGERRKPEYECRQPLIKEHPDRKWLTVIGLAMAVFLIYASLLTNLGVASRLTCLKKANVSSQMDLPFFFDCSF